MSLYDLDEIIKLKEDILNNQEVVKGGDKMTERQKEIINMKSEVFTAYLSDGLSQEEYNKYRDYQEREVTKDKRNHAVTVKNKISNEIATNSKESAFHLKLKELALVFNQPDYFEELVTIFTTNGKTIYAPIAKTFETDEEHVKCQIKLNKIIQRAKAEGTLQEPKKLTIEDRKESAKALIKK